MPYDVLPYADADPSPSERAAAEAIIQLEMRDPTTKRHRPSHDHTGPALELPPVAALELARVEAGLPPPADLQDTLMGTRLAPAASALADPRRARVNYAAACAAAEAARRRLEGAELLARYALPTWKETNHRLEAAAVGLNAEESSLSAQLAQLHERRRIDQLVVAAKIQLYQPSNDAARQ